MPTKIGESLRATTRLQDMRVKRGISQKAFAKKAKIAQSDLSKIETRVRPVGPMVAERLAKAWRVLDNEPSWTVQKMKDRGLLVPWRGPKGAPNGRRNSKRVRT